MDYTVYIHAILVFHDAVFSNDQRTPNFGKSDSFGTCRIISDMESALASGKVKPRLDRGLT